jgi:hypothetical protein
MFRIVAATIFLLVAQFHAFSAFAEERKCGDFIQLMEQLANTHGPMFDSFTFKTGGEGKNTLVLFTGENGEAVKYWSLINRVDDVANFCVVGEGDGKDFGVLQSAETNSFPDKYGMPGSGLPRCAAHNDPLGSIKVRMWANRELGRSQVIYTESQVGPDFTYLFSDENSWIIVRSEKTENKSTCYFARGEELVFRAKSRWKSAGEN